MSVSDVIDGMDEAAARDALTRCCGASRWVETMLSRRPFAHDAVLFEVADAVWTTMTADDVREALAAHPEIGVDLESLRERFAATARWAGSEQARVAGAPEGVLQALAEGNRRYRERFGYRFVVCATGKSAEQMLALLLARLNHEPQWEIQVAAAEQAKITRLRLEKLTS